MNDFYRLWTRSVVAALFVCVCGDRLCSLLKLREIVLSCSIKTETEICLGCIHCPSCFHTERWTESVFFTAAGRNRVRSSHSHTHTFSPSWELLSIISVTLFVLTEHSHQLLRSVCLQELRLSEMRKEKIGAVQGEIEHSSCSVCPHTHTHRVSLS